MGREEYRLGYSEGFLRFMEGRADAATFAHVAQHVEPGMSVLDVVFWSGAITVNLAELSGTGAVVGIDREGSQFARAREQAEQRGLSNVSFQTGSAYELPFEDGHFDIVTENALLMHLSEPERALAEMVRVLKPGGLVAVRDPFLSGFFRHASTPCPVEGGTARLMQAILESQRKHGADYDCGIKHRERLNAAGLLNVDQGASPLVFGNEERLRFLKEHGRGGGDRLRDLSQDACDDGLLSQAEVDAYVDWRLHTLDDPGAFDLRTWLHATGRKPQ